MNILNMTATFGVLDHATLTPGAGLTLIQAPNETGKSTWAVFLRAMLYGFPPRDRDKAGYLAEKNRYQPWSGAAMEGSIELTWQGRSLTLYRGPKGSVPWGAFSAVWTATGEVVEGLTGENCGEVLLGVSREVFERTAFVGQDGALLSPSADLEKRVAALASSGEEEVSFSQVERTLKDWLNRRRSNARNGLIPKLEEELEQVEALQARQEGLLAQAQAALQEREALEAEKAELEAQLQRRAQDQRARQLQSRTQAAAGAEAAQAEYAAAVRAARGLPPNQALRQAQGDLAYLNTLKASLRMAENAVPEAKEKAEAAEKAARSDPFFGGLDPHQAAVRAQRDHDEAARLGRKGPSPLLLLLLPLLASGGLAAWAWLRPRDPAASFPWWSVLVYVLPAVWGAALLLLFPLFLWVRSRKKKAAGLLSHYAAQSPEDILSKATAYAQTCAAAQEAEQALRSAETERDRLAAQRLELSARLLNFVHPFAPEVTDAIGVSAALSRALQQGENCRLAKERLESAQRLLSALPAPGTDQPLLPGGEEAARLERVNLALRQAVDTAARLRGELESLGDPSELSGRRSALLEELERRRGEYEAISAALESLKAADGLLRERFSPAVNQCAGEYLARLTGGRYTKAALTRQFQALAQEEGGVAPRQDLALSGGTVQQLYLAVRLAMCRLALPREEPCPLLLDDALDAFDDHRAKLALDCLLEEAESRQVLLFTCHSREKKLLEGTPAKVLTLA